VPRTVKHKCRNKDMQHNVSEEYSFISTCFALEQTERNHTLYEQKKFFLIPKHF